MSLNNTPSSERIHIGIFGRRNAGKSSIINAVTTQNLAIVSNVAGTTTDPVYKAMEILPLGPVMIIDTPGIDDVGELGELRIEKSYQVLNKTDIAVVIVDGEKSSEDLKLIEKITAKKIPYIVVYNKSDVNKYPENLAENEISVSAQSGENINELRELLSKQLKISNEKMQIVGDLIEKNDIVVLVVPIDSAAPKGRLILPQQQTIRDILEAGAISVVCREFELEETLKQLEGKVKLVITDSQAFEFVSKVVPLDVKLTSFSILMARYKGNLEQNIEGVVALNSLSDGDTVLISEGCTHHRQCDDIGTRKLPRWIESFTGKKISFEFTSGTEFPQNLDKYKLVVHCGGCMIPEREMKYRLNVASDGKIPMTNYGIAIAYMNGILKRSVEVLPDLYNKL